MKTPERTQAVSQATEVLDALPAASIDGVQLEVSGPLSLFRHTMLRNVHRFLDQKAWPRVPLSLRP